MAKKLAGLGAAMIESQAEPQPAAAPSPARAKPLNQYGEPLNFRVPLEFRRRFRRYAADHDMKLNEVLYRAFEALLNTKV
jgi:hypothetical protein